MCAYACSQRDRQINRDTHAHAEARADIHARTHLDRVVLCEAKATTKDLEARAIENDMEWLESLRSDVPNVMWHSTLHSKGGSVRQRPTSDCENNDELDVSESS